MVPGGGGDWLQQEGELLNPYFGSQMLRCGEKVAEYPPAAPLELGGEPREQHAPPTELNEEP
jgi:hypothetical protein